MMKSSWDLARLLKTVSEAQQNQYINDNDRIALLREMQAQLPVNLHVFKLLIEEQL
jgi:hypothetical protein